MEKIVTALEYPQLKEVECPCCGAFSPDISFVIKNCEVTWEEENRRFLVNMSFDAMCTGDGEEWTEIKEVGQVPVIIAEKSHCSCGGILTLKDHTLRKKDGFVEFSGEYVCDKCHQAQNTLLQKIGKGLASFWEKTKKIEVGPEGFSYEKEAISNSGA